MKKTPSADRRKKNGRAFAKKTAERKNHGQRELLRVTAAGKRPTGARCSRGHRIVLGRADCRTGESARNRAGKSERRENFLSDWPRDREGRKGITLCAGFASRRKIRPALWPRKNGREPKSTKPNPQLAIWSGNRKIPAALSSEQQKA
jgi:hypothetical protein